MTLKNTSQSNLPRFGPCFQNWLSAQTDDDLSRALKEDVGEMIRDRVVAEIERRGVGSAVIPFSVSDGCG